MENTLYRLITSTEGSSAAEKETFLDYLDYEEALSSYNKAIETKTSSKKTVDPMFEPFLLIQNDYESNENGQWHWCALKTDKGHTFTMRIEPIQFFEAEYFASEEIKSRYEALYGHNDTAPSFFTRFFKRKK